MYTKNNKTLLKVTKDLKKGKDVLCSWVRSLIVVKVARLSHTDAQVQRKPHHNPSSRLPAGIDKGVQKCTRKPKGTICKEENEVGGLTPLNFKFYYKAILIQTMRYWHKDSYTDQQNRTESRNKP